MFLRENKNNHHVPLHNEEFVVMLTYRADVFGHFYDMNLSLQSRDVTVSDVKNKLAGITARMGSLASTNQDTVHYLFFFVEKVPENE